MAQNFKGKNYKDTEAAFESGVHSVSFSGSILNNRRSKTNPGITNQLTDVESPDSFLEKKK